MKTMKNETKLIRLLPLATFAAVVLLTTLACSNNGYDQDPLADQTDVVREGVPPQFGRKPPVPKPIPAEALKIDANDFYSFREGVEGQVKLSGRVLLPVEGRDAVMNQDFVITIENLGDFPGAVFDSQAGLFKWKPTPTMSGVEALRNKSLDVTLSTVFTPIMSVSRSIPVFVSRAENDPQVVAIDGLPIAQRVREGEVRDFTVKVKDIDANNVLTNRPRLMVVSGNTFRGVNVSGLVHVVPSTSSNENPVRDANDPDMWIFKLRLDLSKAELTPREDTFNFHLIAVNRYGRTSIPFAVTKPLYSSVREPQISLSKDRKITVKAGSQASITFMVYDPADEHHISAAVANCAALPGGARCRCDMADGNSSFQQCTIDWKVPESLQSGEFQIVVETANRSAIPSDQLRVEKTFTRSIVVQSSVSPIYEAPVFKSVVNGGTK